MVMKVSSRTNNTELVKTPIDLSFYFLTHPQ